MTRSDRAAAVAAAVWGLICLLALAWIAGVK